MGLPLFRRRSWREEVLKGSHSLWAYAAIRVVALCWGRVSEVLGLRWDRGTFLEDGYATIVEHKGKKKAGAKHLEIPPPAAEILRKLPREGDDSYTTSPAEPEPTHNPGRALQGLGGGMRPGRGGGTEHPRLPVPGSQ